MTQLSVDINIHPFRAKYFWYALVVLAALFFSLMTESEVVCVSVVLVMGFRNLFKGKESFGYNFILLLLVALFYNAYSDDLLGFEFDGEASAVILAQAANMLGLVTLFTAFIHRHDYERYTWTRVDTWLAVYCVWLVLTTLMAVDVPTSLEELSRLPGFLLLYAFTRMFLSKDENWRKYFTVSFAAIFAITIFSIYKLATGQYYGTLGKFCFFLAPLVYLFWRSGIWRLSLPVLTLIVGSGAMLVSESRRVLLSIGLTWLISGVKNLRSVALIIPVLFLLNYFVQLIDEQGEGRYLRTFEQLADIGGGDGVSQKKLDQIGTGRGSLWGAALGLIIDHPVLGVGVGNMNRLMPSYGNVQQQRAHNILLDVAGQMGLVGLAIFISLNGHVFRRGRRIGRMLKESKDQSYRQLLAAVSLGLAVVLIASLFGGSVLFDKWGWVYYGVIAAVLEKADKEGNREPDMQQAVVAT